MTELQHGHRLCDRYTIVSHIADGAAASVYEARDTQSGTTVALKVLDPLRGADAIGRARFEREFHVLSKISHPGIARSIAFEKDGDTEFLVLEHIEGTTLAERLIHGRFERFDEALMIALGLATTLAACHAAGVIHRDLKPANVMIHPTRGPVILDFGVAWFSAAANLTRTGAVIGSPQYMAPEVFGSSYVDARADVYAVGSMLFEMLTGRPMRLGANVVELAARTHEVPPAVSTLRTDVLPFVDAIVARAVAPRPEDRFATAHELATALGVGGIGAPSGLKSRTTCRRCRAAHVVDLPFCPGCGVEVSWQLAPGAYAVQLVQVDDVEHCARWLEARHRSALTGSPMGLRARLEHMPVPVAVGVAEATAEQLVAEANEAGAKAEIVRARLIGRGTSLPRMRASPATTRQVLAAWGVHLGLVLTLGIWITILFRPQPALEVTLYFLPSLVAGALGIAARMWVRRPLLKLPQEASQPETLDHLRIIRRALEAIQTDRARALATSAILRAAPALAGPRAGTFPTDAKHRAWQSLLDALAASSELDAHAEYLQGRSRVRISAEITAVRARVAAGEDGAQPKLVELEQEKADLLEAAIAHDLAARRALEHTQEISMALG